MIVTFKDKYGNYIEDISSIDFKDILEIYINDVYIAQYLNENEDAMELLNNHLLIEYGVPFTLNINEYLINHLREIVEDLLGELEDE